MIATAVNTVHATASNCGTTLRALPRSAVPLPAPVSSPRPFALTAPSAHVSKHDEFVFKTRNYVLKRMNCAGWQPLEFSVLDAHTVQLNTTYISGKAASLRYAMHDYPTMVVFDSDGRPAPPFNVTIPFAGF